MQKKWLINDFSCAEVHKSNRVFVFTAHLKEKKETKCVLGKNVYTIILVAVQFWVIEWKWIISSAWNQKEYTWDKNHFLHI